MMSSSSWRGGPVAKASDYGVSMVQIPSEPLVSTSLVEYNSHIWKAHVN